MWLPCWKLNGHRGWNLDMNGEFLYQAFTSFNQPCLDRFILSVKINAMAANYEKFNNKTKTKTKFRSWLSNSEWGGHPIIDKTESRPRFSILSSRGQPNQDPVLTGQYEADPLCQFSWSRTSLDDAKVLPTGKNQSFSKKWPRENRLLTKQCHQTNRVQTNHNPELC